MSLMPGVARARERGGQGKQASLIERWCEPMRVGSNLHYSG